MADEYHLPPLEDVKKRPVKQDLREGNVSLILEAYDDLFSDFDARPYSEKALSHDLLQECRMAVRDKDETHLELRLMLPKKLRDVTTEAIIRRRLKNHFVKHHKEMDHEMRKVRVRGTKLFAGGIVCMMVAAYLYGLEGHGFFYNLLIVTFEPAAWFMFWTGLDEIYFGSREKRPEYEFYKKMANIEIMFLSY